MHGRDAIGTVSADAKKLGRVARESRIDGNGFVTAYAAADEDMRLVMNA